MEIVFVTGYSPGYKPAAKCVPTLREYCNRKGYKLIVDVYDELGINTHMCKTDSVLAALTPTNTVIWVDADCLVLDFDFDAGTLVHHELAFSQDHNGLCAGFIVTKAVGADLFAAVKLIGRLKLKWRERYVGKVDQPVIKLLLEASQKWKHSFIPVEVVSNPFCPPETIQKSFIYHLWGHNANRWEDWLKRSRSDSGELGNENRYGMAPQFSYVHALADPTQQARVFDSTCAIVSRQAGYHTLDGDQ
jgi:hypothetical protein